MLFGVYQKLPVPLMDDQEEDVYLHNPNNDNQENVEISHEEGNGMNLEEREQGNKNNGEKHQRGNKKKWRQENGKNPKFDRSFPNGMTPVGIVPNDMGTKYVPFLKQNLDDPSTEVISKSEIQIESIKTSGNTMRSLKSVKLVGCPFKATHSDVFQFFKGPFLGGRGETVKERLTITPDGIIFNKKSSGIPEDFLFNIFNKRDYLTSIFSKISTAHLGRLVPGPKI